MISAEPPFPDRAAIVIRRTVTVVVFVIAGLSFAFGFGNGWQLGITLGVPGWIAPLVAPAVDLSVVALLSSVQFLRSQGIGGRLIGPRLLLIFCGLLTFSLNTTRPLLSGQDGRACFDAIAPLLLIGWSEVGPRLLALLHGAVRDENPAVQDGPGPSGKRQDQQLALPRKITDTAFRLNAEHQERTGRPISRDNLRARLRVSNTVAGELLKLVRAPPHA
jgi:hypothetical protein